MNIIRKFHQKTLTEKRFITVSFIAFLICTALGVLFHFSFDLLGEGMLAGALFPVNESVGEHLKLSYLPYLLLIPIEFLFYGKKVNNFLFGKLLGVSSAIITVLSLYYTLNGAFGKMPDFVNIIIFVIATATSYVIPYIFYKHNTEKSQALQLIAIIGFLTLGAILICFSFYPPKIPLYLDPKGSGYGYYMIQK